MTLWILTARTDLPEDDDPWGGELDKMYSCVIRAASPEEARQIAHDHAMGEIKGHDEKIIDSNRLGIPCKEYTHGNRMAWIDAKYSTCEEVSPDGAPELIMLESSGF